MHKTWIFWIRSQISSWVLARSLDHVLDDKDCTFQIVNNERCLAIGQRADHGFQHVNVRKCVHGESMLSSPYDLPNSTKMSIHVCLSSEFKNFANVVFKLGSNLIEHRLEVLLTSFPRPNCVHRHVLEVFAVILFTNGRITKLVEGEKELAHHSWLNKLDILFRTRSFTFVGHEIRTWQCWIRRIFNLG